MMFRKILLGPLALSGATGKTGGLLATFLLTVFTQVGGLVLWPFWAVVFSRSAGFTPWKRRGFRFACLSGIYLLCTLLVLPLVASQTGRVRLPLFATEELPTGPLTIAYPLLNRNYVRPHTRDAFTKAVRASAAKHPGMVVRYLDAGFPFPTIHLLPHISHQDGQRIDVAFQFQQDGEPVDRALSPIGYWGYAKESHVRSECAGKKGKIGPVKLDLRWDFDWLQPIWPDLELNRQRNRTLFKELARDRRVCSILLEPTLHRTLASSKLAKNGCEVARHDDHFHLTIKQRCDKKKK
jgi:hypothetical protein